MTSTAARYQSAFFTPEKATARSAMSLTPADRPKSAKVQHKDTFRLFRSDRDAAGMLVMQPKEHWHDRERLYEDSLRLKAEINRLKEENKQLRTRLTRLEKGTLPPIESTSAETLEQVVRDQQTALRKKDEEIVTLKREIQFYKIPDFMERLRQAQMDSDAMRKILDTERSNFVDLREKVKELQERLVGKSRECEKLTEDVVRLTEELKDANQRRAVVEEELQTRKDLKKIPLLKNEILKLKIRNEMLEKDIEALNRDMKGKSAETEALQWELTAAITAGEAKDAENEQLRTALQRLEADITTLRGMLEDEHNRSETVTKTSQQMEKELEMLRRQLKNLTTTLASREAEIDKLRSTVDAQQDSFTKQIQSLQEDAKSEKIALNTQNGILTNTVTDMRKQIEEKLAQIIKCGEREQGLKAEAEKREEEIMLKNAEIDALKGQIEDLNRQVEDWKDRLDRVKEQSEQKISALHTLIASAADVLFRKVRKRLKKHDIDPAQLMNYMSEAGKETTDPKHFRKSLKPFKINVEKLALKVGFRLLGSESGEVALTVIHSELVKETAKEEEKTAEKPEEHESEETQKPGSEAEQ